MENAKEYNTVAIVSYITLVGWIVAFVLYGKNKTDLGAYHLRQSLGLFLTGIILWWIPIVGWILNVLVFLFWVIGLIYAIQGDKKPVPIAGEFYQSILKGIA
jgi:uncharacterized membrane protein